MGVGDALRQVFSSKRYCLLAISVAAAVFVLATWLPNLGLVWQIVTSTTIALFDKARILAALVTSIGTNFTIFSAIVTSLVAALFGINVAMITYGVRLGRSHRRSNGAAVGASIGGLTSGGVAIGCAACGTFVVGPLLSLVGAGSLVTLMPFGGEEFGVLGAGLLGGSLLLNARRITTPAACGVDNSTTEAGRRWLRRESRKRLYVGTKSVDPGERQERETQAHSIRGQKARSSSAQ